MRRGDDSGAALILVLVVVTVLGLVLGALLSFTDTNLRTTLALRDQASTAYEVDGAAQAAINNLRNSSYDAAAGQHCFGGTDTLALNNFAGSDSAAVTCSADPAKVLVQCPSLSQCNRPGTAILTLGRIAGEDGLNVTQPTGSAFNVHGIVFSNSTIDMVKGSLVTNAAAYARGACTGTVTSTPPVQCNYATANPLGNDPGYAAATTTVPAHQNLPACTKANSVITFQPGYYDDAVGLSNMMAGNSSCKHSTWWFRPGTYYFDFHNGGAGPNPLLSGGSDLWTVNDGYLVAGTPTNAAGGVIAQPPVPATIPGSCDNPINDAHASGVQFVFGGDSQLAVKAGQAEICGSYSANKPPIAVYGLTSGAESPSTTTLKATSVVATGNFTNATVASLSDVDGNLATWANNSNGNQSTTVAVGGYGPPAAIPAGSVLRSAQLRVVHGNTAGSTQDTLSVKITPTGGTAYTATVPSHGDNVLHTDAIDVSQGGTGTLAQQVYAGTFTGAQLAYSAAVKHKGIEQLDSMQLDLTYTPPALRAESGCITVTPYGSGGSCAVITTINNSGGLFYVQGTTYTPGAVLDITLNNATEQVFRFGVIARSLWVKETGSFAYTGPVIEVPDDSPGFVLSVFLAVTVCPKQATCAPSSSPSLTAKVAIVDTDPTTPVPGRRQISVLSWSSQR